MGVPEIVTVLEDQDAETPGGKPMGSPMPVAPEVVWVMGGREVLKQTLGLAIEGAETERLGVTEIEPAAFTFPQPPVSGIL
jgi:hypothetical protein